MKTKNTFALLSLLAMALVAATAYGGMKATRVENAIWAGGELFDTVLTPATFTAPPAHSTDVIYDFSMSGLVGQRSVAESAPGDREYNGGRWNVQMVAFTPQGITIHDPDSDGTVNFELTSAEDVLQHEALGHLIINPANFYFECPLLPNHGQ
jgi:hypothetical protein